MEAFYQLESSAITTTNNNPLINLVKDMVSTLKKSAATLTAVSSAEKVDPSLIVCKCKFIFKVYFFKLIITFPLRWNGDMEKLKSHDVL